MKKKKCIYADCKNKVVGEFGIDIDLPHFPFCEKHRQNAANSLMWAAIGIQELSDEELGLNKKKPKTRFKIPRAKMKK